MRSFIQKWSPRASPRASHPLFAAWPSSWPAGRKAAPGSWISSEGTSRSLVSKWPGRLSSWPRRCCPMKVEGGKVRARGAKLEIDELRERHAALNEAKIRAEEKKKEKVQRLEELKAQAREAYGTDDLPELKKKLEDMKADNEARRAEYQKHLEAIEDKLAEVEAKHDALQSGEEDR